MKNGFLRIASVSPLHRVADVEYNTEQIINSIKELESKNVEIAVYPELAVTGYTCADLFHSSVVIKAAEKSIERLRSLSETLDIHVIIGVPRKEGTKLMNSAAFIHNGTVDFIDKTYLPNYNEFYEKRWFSAGRPENQRVFQSHGTTIGIEICEDLWSPVPPSCFLAMNGANVIFNLSASDAQIGKHNYLLSLIRQQSARCICAYAYSSAGFGESTTDLVFLPNTIICENGTILEANDNTDYTSAHTVISDIDIEALERDRMHNTTFHDCALNNECSDDGFTAEYNFNQDFSPEYRTVDAHPFVPPTDDLIDERCREIAAIQECGLASRLAAIGNPKIVIGISGGLDSTLALLVAVATMRKLGRALTDIIAITMPGFGTTDRTYDNALTLMKQLGVSMREIRIADAVNLHFRDIGHDARNHDVTYENSQARERTQILMDVANQVNGIVLGTGDLSELALGWATYNGDHMSMYGVNAGVPKTLVKFLVRHYANISNDEILKKALWDVIDTPISPELTPADEDGNIAQKTESLVGPYELNDFFLYYMLRYGFSPCRVFMLACKAFDGEYEPAVIKKWIRLFYRRFFSQQFKRSCLPDGPKVGSVCLSPRGDWRMPSDLTSALWLRDLETLL